VSGNTGWRHVEAAASVRLDGETVDLGPRWPGPARVEVLGLPGWAERAYFEEIW